MSPKRRESLGLRHRMRSARDFEAVRAGSRAFRGAHCLLLVLPRPAEDTRIGFVASRRSVGGAVARNRARRRLREIVRRRFPRMPASGYWMVFVAHRTAGTAPHQELASEVERLLAAAGALEPLPGGLH